MRKYIEIFKLQIKKNISYRFQIWARLLGDIMFIYMWYCVWKGLYAGKTEVQGVSFSETILYVIMAQLLITLNNASSPIWRTDNLFRTGNIANELIKPYNFSVRILSECVGDAVAYFILSSFWVFSIAMIVLKINLPTSISVWIMFTLSAILGFLIRFFIELCFSYLSFWIIHIGGVRIIFLFSISLFSGSVIPLWFFPDVLRAIANILPFKYIYYVPNLIITDGSSIIECLRLIGFQLLWLVIMIFISYFIWRKGNKKIVIQGG